tara:strand:+ start:1755 stop:2423 length:669 start_codon:yes stop_codon:yes gene_type:complete
MEKKRLVIYTFKKNKNLNLYSFGNQYMDKNGLLRKLVDINGLEVSYKTSNSTFTLDLSIENDRLSDEWLKDNPSILSDWVRTDMVQAEKQETEDTLSSAQAIIEAAKMNVKAVIDFAKLSKMNLNSDTEVLRAKIIKIAQKNPQDFIDIHFDPEKDYRVFIVDALKSKNLTYKNSTFMYGKEAIGTNEEQVIVWLKENKDIFALIKHELRGDEPKKVNKKVK